MIKQSPTWIWPCVMNYEEKTLIAARKKKTDYPQRKMHQIDMRFLSNIRRKKTAQQCHQNIFSLRLGSKAVSDTYYLDKLLNLFMPQFPYL